MEAVTRVFADMKGAPPKQQHAVFVSSMEQEDVASFKGAPPKQTRAVSVSSTEVMGYANIQGVPTTYNPAVSVSSTEAVHILYSSIQIAPSKHRIALSLSQAF